MVEWFNRSNRAARRFARGALFAVGATLAVSLLIAPASAQYSFDPSNEDELGPGIKYFGSAKDDRGALLAGVTVKIASTNMLVTDVMGRYRGSVDPNNTVNDTVVVCSKPGYQFVRVNKRPGPVGGKQTVEADCVLHKAQ